MPGIGGPGHVEDIGGANQSGAFEVRDHKEHDQESRRPIRLQHLDESGPMRAGMAQKTQPGFTHPVKSGFTQLEIPRKTWVILGFIQK